MWTSSLVLDINPFRSRTETSCVDYCCIFCDKPALTLKEENFIFGSRIFKLILLNSHQVPKNKHSWRLYGVPHVCQYMVVLLVLKVILWYLCVDSTNGYYYLHFHKRMLRPIEDMWLAQSHLANVWKSNWYPSLGDLAVHAVFSKRLTSEGRNQHDMFPQMSFVSPGSHFWICYFP